MATLTCTVCGTLNPTGSADCHFCDSPLRAPEETLSEDTGDSYVRPAGDPFADDLASNTARFVLRCDSGLEIEVTEGAVVALGRNPLSPISLTAPDNISFNHALITMDSSGPCVTDQGSTNGTTVDGRHLEPSVPFSLSTGCTIELARNPTYRLRVEEKAP